MTDAEVIAAARALRGWGQSGVTISTETRDALLDVLAVAAAPEMRHECSPDDGGCPFCNVIGSAIDALRTEIER